MARILVIEDHDTLRNQIVQVLKLTQHDVIGADSGTAGVRLAQEVSPDLILCDAMIDGADSFEVLQRIREHPGTMTTPFILLTAKDDGASARQGTVQGADDCLTKPFTTEELLAAVQNRLQRRDARVPQPEIHIDQARQQLMHMVKHDLRAPLTSINMTVDILSRQIDYLSPDQLQELLNTLGSGSKRLSRLVDQIVLLTQLRTGALDSASIAEQGEAVLLWDLLLAAVGLARRFAVRNPNLTIELEDGDRNSLVAANPQALKHALAELIANALNVSPDDGAVTIAQWADEEAVWISIADTGPGIDPEQIDQALRQFQESNRAGHDPQGMGLGLGLALHLVQAHGGTLELQATRGKGTTAIIALPLVTERV